MPSVASRIADDRPLVLSTRAAYRVSASRCHSISISDVRRPRFPLAVRRIECVVCREHEHAVATRTLSSWATSHWRTADERAWLVRPPSRTWHPRQHRAHLRRAVSTALTYPLSSSPSLVPIQHAGQEKIASSRRTAPQGRRIFGANMYASYRCLRRVCRRQRHA